jgi:hypothetical protein
MKFHRPLLAVAAIVFGAGLALESHAKLAMFSHIWGDVIVATDTTMEGRELTPPTVDSPVYYLGQSIGAKLGTIAGDELPDTKEMTQFVVDVLAKQGYVGAKPGVHDPTLFLVLQWGFLRPDRDDLMWFLGYNPNNDIAAPSAIGTLGMEVFRRGMRSREIETILENASETNYAIIITAFEYKSANAENPIAYWQTRIALPTRGKSMAHALPTMVAAAGPAIGLPSSSPLLMDADSPVRGHVKLGELEFLDFDEEAAPANGSEAKK